jgi:hypothetical protein
MTLFPNLLAILAMLLISGGGGTTDPIVEGSVAVHSAGQSVPVADSIFCPAHHPPTSESIFECLDESALDEEDSVKVEDHGIATPTFLDFDTPQTSVLLASFLPSSPHSQLVLIAPILRC